MIMFVVALTNEAKVSDVTVAVQGNFAKKTKMQIELRHEIIIVIKRTFYILQFFVKLPETATVSMLVVASFG
jgi:hypothetical protein